MRRGSAPTATRVRFAYWGSAVVIVSAAWACGQPAAQAPPPPKVTVVLPVEREVTEWDEYTARFDAVDSVEVRPRVNGYLQEIHFKDLVLTTNPDDKAWDVKVGEKQKTDK